MIMIIIIVIIIILTIIIVFITYNNFIYKSSNSHKTIKYWKNYYLMSYNKIALILCYKWHKMKKQNNGSASRKCDQKIAWQ